MIAAAATVLAAGGCSPPSHQFADRHECSVPGVSLNRTDDDDHPHGVDERHGPKTLNDLARLREFIIKAARLAHARKTVPAATLSRQLTRKQCRLRLAAPATKPLSSAEIYRRRIGSVVIVGGLSKCGKCDKWHVSSASGLVIAPSGVIATNYHLFADKRAKTFVAMTHDRKVFAVKEVLAASASDDVVILQLDTGGAKLDAAPLAANAPIGSPVTVISHPSRRFYSLTTGVVSRYSTMRTKRGRAKMMAITADFAKGSSGAPVFDDHGNIIGMVASTTSVYYTKTKNKQQHLQMVFKNCVPSASILKLFKRR